MSFMWVENSPNEDQKSNRGGHSTADTNFAPAKCSKITDEMTSN